ARALLENAAAQVPYYRRLFAERGIKPQAIRTMADFRRVPLLERSTCQEQGAAMVADSLPEGTVATGRAFTSGSTGLPVTVLQTNVVNLIWQGLYLRDAEWCGFDQRGSLAVIRSTLATGEQLARYLTGVVGPFWNRAFADVINTGP